VIKPTEIAQVVLQVILLISTPILNWENVQCVMKIVKYVMQEELVQLALMEHSSIKILKFVNYAHQIA